MKAIWKVELEITESQAIELPINAKILCVKVQHDIPCMWFINPDLNNDLATEYKTIMIYGMSHTHMDIKGKYIGTVMTHGESLVWHIFEE